MIRGSEKIRTINPATPGHFASQRASYGIVADGNRASLKKRSARTSLNQSGVGQDDKNA
jgi:hypothetical protein